MQPYSLFRRRAAFVLPIGAIVSSLPKFSVLPVEAAPMNTVNDARRCRPAPSVSITG